MTKLKPYLLLFCFLCSSSFSNTSFGETFVPIMAGDITIMIPIGPIQEGEESSETLPGKDNDNDGVRDDVQQNIVAKYGTNSPIATQSLDIARKYQKILSGTLTAQQINQQIADAEYLNSCIQNTTGTNTDGLGYVVPLQLNTVERSRAYLTAARDAYHQAGPPSYKSCGNSIANKSQLTKVASKINAPDLNNYDIYFINGVRTDERDANEIKEELQTLIKKNPVELLWNKNDHLGQFFDLFVEKIGEVNVDKSDISDFWIYVLAGDLPAPISNAIWWATQRWLDPNRDVGYWSEKDLERMVERIKTSLENNRKTLVVSHSQGNFFYRNIWQELNGWDTDKTQQCFAGIGIAPPLSSKPGNFDYITNSNDTVINKVREYWPYVLKSNVNVPKGYNNDKDGHGLLKTYLDHSAPLSRFETELKQAVKQIDESCELCDDSEMAIWVANDNNAMDDNFDLYINNKFLSYLNLGTNDCNGHFILPDKYNQFDKHDLTFHKDVTKEVDGCIGSLSEDSSSKTYFSGKLPLTQAETKYEVSLTNKQNNYNGNYGKIYSFQICPNPKNGKPIVRRVLGSAIYSGGSGENIDSFDFKTGDCLPCDDLGNTSSFPDNKVTVRLESDGTGICQAKIKLNGDFAGWAYSSGGSAYPRLAPGPYKLQLYDFSQSCQIGTSSSHVGVNVLINENKVASAWFLAPEAHFVVPALNSPNGP